MKRTFLIIWCILWVGFVCILPAQAFFTGFYSTPMSQEMKALLEEETNLKLVMNDAYSGGVQCFDVDVNGSYALGFDGINNSRIFVYDASGSFLYGYSFTSVGAYGIQFCENSDCLAIYFTRDKCYLVYDRFGKCVDAQDVVKSDTNSKLAREILSREYKEVAGKKYALERDIGIGPEYSRFVVTNEAGERTVLFDKTADVLIKQILGIVLFLTFVVLVIRIAIKKSKEEGTW